MGFRLTTLKSQMYRNELPERLSGIYNRHTTSIIDFYLAFTYIAQMIRPTLRPLYTIPSPVLLSFDRRGVRDYPVVVQMDGPIWFGVILRYQPPELSWRRRQHDALRCLLF